MKKKCPPYGDAGLAALVMAVKDALKAADEAGEALNETYRAIEKVGARIDRWGKKPRARRPQTTLDLGPARLAAAAGYLLSAGRLAAAALEDLEDLPT